MPRYLLKYGTHREFNAQTAGEVVPFIQEGHFTGASDPEDEFVRRLAMEMCEWNGKWYRINSRDLLAKDMIKHGLLECVD